MQLRELIIAVKEKNMRTKNLTTKKCRNCGVEFTKWAFRKATFCSRGCSQYFFVGEKNAGYKGSEVGYYGLHKWVEKELGKPKQCESCKTIKAKKYEWANKSRSYKRELSDWVRMCVACHHYYDGTSKVKPFNYHTI